MQQKINEIEPQLNRDLDAYTADLATLNRDIATFNSRANSGYYTSQQQFEADRASLQARISALSAVRSGINDRVATYNAYVKELNSIAIRVSELNESINAAPAVEGVE